MLSAGWSRPGTANSLAIVVAFRVWTLCVLCCHCERREAISHVSSHRTRARLLRCARNDSEEQHPLPLEPLYAIGRQVEFRWSATYQCCHKSPRDRPQRQPEVLMPERIEHLRQTRRTSDNG